MLEGFERRGVYALRAVIRISGYLDAAEGFAGYPDAAGRPPVCRADAGNEEMN